MWQIMLLRKIHKFWSQVYLCIWFGCRAHFAKYFFFFFFFFKEQKIMVILNLKTKS